MSKSWSLQGVYVVLSWLPPTLHFCTQLQLIGSNALLSVVVTLTSAERALANS